MSSTSKTQQQAQEVSASDLAKRLKVDPKDLRKWLRSEGKGLGERGKRYSFTKRQATEIVRQWNAAHKDES